MIDAAVPEKLCYVLSVANTQTDPIGPNVSLSSHSEAHMQNSRRLKPHPAIFCTSRSIRLTRYLSFSCSSTCDMGNLISLQAASYDNVSKEQLPVCLFLPREDPFGKEEKLLKNNFIKLLMYYKSRRWRF